MEVVVRHLRRAKGHAEKAVRVVHHHAFRTPRLIALSSGVLVLLGIIGFQVWWPTDRMVLFASVDGVSVSAQTKDEARASLDTAYTQATVPIFISDEPTTPKVQPTLAELGFTIEHEARLNSIDFPWYWRLIPTSGLWYHLLISAPEPDIARSDERLTQYIDETFGQSCQVAPTNASIEFRGSELVVVPEKPGSTCDSTELRAALEAVAPSLTPSAITISGETVPATLTVTQAEETRSSLIETIGQGFGVRWQDIEKQVSAATAYSWLTISETEGVLKATLNEAGRGWLSENFATLTAVAAGASQVVTRDFVEVSRVNGATGRALDLDATATAVELFLNGASESVPTVQTKPVPPTVSYTRTYSPTDTGLSALMKNFAESRPGIYGIRLIELSGARRNASYNGDRQFTTASTYKLFVAYSTLLRLESGAWNWSDQISGGRDLARCFDDMIVKSDNPCADALLRKIGFTQITNEARAIGATRTSFLGNDGIKSTANDEALLLSLLYSGQILSQQASRDRFISALQRNIYRQGIPAGIPTATVANKVGFLDAWLHDAAIVTAPTGTYVLVILTESSSWATIADFAREIEALRSQ